MAPVASSDFRRSSPTPLLLVPNPEHTLPFPGLPGGGPGGGPGGFPSGEAGGDPGGLPGRGGGAPAGRCGSILFAASVALNPWVGVFVCGLKELEKDTGIPEGEIARSRFGRPWIDGTPLLRRREKCGWWGG